jgi:hypothetical protein
VTFYLFGAAGTFVLELVRPASGMLVISPFVAGNVAEAALVDAGGFGELFPQPVPASMVIPKLIARKYLQVFIVAFLSFLRMRLSNTDAHRCEY